VQSSVDAYPLFDARIVIGISGVAIGDPVITELSMLFNIADEIGGTFTSKASAGD
jgi:hypothetical protein